MVLQGASIKVLELSPGHFVPVAAAKTAAALGWRDFITRRADDVTLGDIIMAEGLNSTLIPHRHVSCQSL